MNNYIKEIENNKIIFKNKSDNTKLIVTHDDNEYIFDTIFVDEKYNLNFIEYIIKELKKTKDISVVFSLYDSLDLEKLMLENDLKVSSYQYNIKFINELEISKYDISENLDKEGENYYLKIINHNSKINHEYFNPSKKYNEITEDWFLNKEFIHRTYKKDGNIVGIVDYINIENNLNHKKIEPSILDYNNKLCIRCILSEDKQVLEDIIKDLLNTYKKDIIISITHTDKYLKDIVKKLNSRFDFCQYILVDEINNFKGCD